MCAVQVESSTLNNDVSRPLYEKFWVAPRAMERDPVIEDHEADEYDAMVKSHANLLNRPFIRMLAKWSLKKAHILDIGTGPGWIPIALAQLKPEWKFCALDPSKRMLERAREHAHKAGVADRIDFIQGRAEELPFPDGHFDLVGSHFMLHHLESPVRMFNEVARVTRGGGKIMIKDLLRQPRWKSKFLMGFSKFILRYNRPQLNMYQESLDAAFTMREIRQALAESQLTMAKVSTFRSLDFVIEG